MKKEELLDLVPQVFGPRLHVKTEKYIKLRTLYVGLAWVEGYMGEKEFPPGLKKLLSEIRKVVSYDLFSDIPNWIMKGKEFREKEKP